MRVDKLVAAALAAVKTPATKIVGAIAVLTLICGVGHASTLLLGDSIDVVYVQNTQPNEDIGTITVTNSPQSFLNFGGGGPILFSITISSTSIVVNDSSFAGTYCCSFNGLYFINETVSPFPSYVLDPSSVLTGGTPAISIVGNTLEVNWAGESFPPDSQLVLDFTPLPSTWLMLLSGFVGFGFFAYRGMKKNAAAIAAA